MRAIALSSFEPSLVPITLHLVLFSFFLLSAVSRLVCCFALFCSFFLFSLVPFQLIYRDKIAQRAETQHRNSYFSDEYNDDDEKEVKELLTLCVNETRPREKAIELK